MNEVRDLANESCMVTATTLAVTVLALVWSQKQLSNEKLIAQS